MRFLALIAFAVVFAGANALAQEAMKTPDSKATSTPPAVIEEADEKAWSFSASATTYIVPDFQEYVQPTFTADRGWLHLEARYNYENLENGIGVDRLQFQRRRKNWSGNSRRCWAACLAIRPASRPATSFRLLIGSSSFPVKASGSSTWAIRRDSFFYNWSELSVSPVDWFRFGLVGQRTRAYQTDVDIQRGLLVGFSYKEMNFTTYVFNLDQDEQTWVFSVGVSF